jgi:hypothetical protein
MLVAQLKIHVASSEQIPATSQCLEKRAFIGAGFQPGIEKKKTSNHYSESLGLTQLNNVT